MKFDNLPKPFVDRFFKAKLCINLCTRNKQCSKSCLELKYLRRTEKFNFLQRANLPGRGPKPKKRPFVCRKENIEKEMSVLRSSRTRNHRQYFPSIVIYPISIKKMGNFICLNHNKIKN